jgi:hypothetical protein
MDAGRRSGLEGNAQRQLVEELDMLCDARWYHRVVQTQGSWRGPTSLVYLLSTLTWA